MYEFQERDWKLLRNRLPRWQEAYMGRLVKEYAQILASDERASSRFWALDERIREDRRKAGVVVENLSRSRMFETIARLRQEGAISADDLEGFSDGLREAVELSLRPSPWA